MGSTTILGRALISAMMLLALAPPGVAQAANYDGQVAAPVYVPAVAKQLYAMDEDFNGLTGFVIEFPHTIVLGTPYKIRTVSGVQPVDLDVHFYSTLTSSSPCGYNPESPDGPNQYKSTVPCSAKAAVVLMATGAGASFRLIV